jgi:heme/copper-type cytochrome/quinol oxidase subunit 2
MLLSIVDESSAMRSEATAGRDATDILTFTVYVPVSSFVISVAIILLYNSWKSRRAKKFEALEIHQKGSS